MGISLKSLVADRDAAFMAFVMDDDWTLLKQYCDSYGVPMPDDPRVLAAGVYKAVQVIAGMPDAVKVRAAVKCARMGFKPMSHGDRFLDSSGREEARLDNGLGVDYQGTEGDTERLRG